MQKPKVLVHFLFEEHFIFSNPTKVKPFLHSTLQTESKLFEFEQCSFPFLTL